MDEEVRNPLVKASSREGYSSKNIELPSQLSPAARASSFGKDKNANSTSPVPAAGVASSVSPRQKHPASDFLTAHDSILEEIEQNDHIFASPSSSGSPSVVGGGEGEGIGGGKDPVRGRTASLVAEELRLGVGGGLLPATTTARKYSMESIDGKLKEYQKLTAKSIYNRLLKVLDSIYQRFEYRVNVYCILFFFLCLLIFSSNLSAIRSWVILFFALLALDLVTMLADHLFFVYVIDKLFRHHFDIAYILHALNGPLGLIVAVFFANNSFNSFDAVQAFPNWHRYILALILILLLICLKNWLTRRHYIRLLEKRFAEKLFQIETWNIIFSELASKKPPKVHHHQPPTTTAAGGAGRGRERGGGDGEEDLKKNDHGIGTMFSAGMHKIQKRVLNVFVDLVEATSKYNDDYEDDVDIISHIHAQKQRGSFVQVNRSPSINLQQGGNAIVSPGTSSKKDTSLEERNKQELLRKRRSFWDLAARISINLGALKIHTYNGPIVIRRKFQAKEFGKVLYYHLSQGGKFLITPHLLETLIKKKETRLPAEGEFPVDYLNDLSNNNSISDKNSNNLIDDVEIGKGERASILSPSTNNNDPLNNIDSGKGGGLGGRGGEYDPFAYEEEKQQKALYDAAIALFDPFKLGFISEEQCMAAVVSVYKEYRLAASSLNNYGELHQSLRGVIDFIFWTIVVVILQSYLSVQVYNLYILPFLTMAFTVSFALGPGLSNIFLATVFVFFMIPYEIGNKIYIGMDPNTRIIGFVRGVSLLYTTITTGNNEVMKIPNHSLFMEKICNLSESGGVVYEVIVKFNLLQINSSSSDSSQSNIDSYFEAVKQYVTEENKEDWKGFSYWCQNIDLEKDIIQYHVSVTHRECPVGTGKPLRSKLELLEFMRGQLLKMNLSYQQKILPVAIVASNGGALSNGDQIEEFKTLNDLKLGETSFDVKSI